MAQNKQYKNPPIVEVVFEFVFQATNWTVITPGNFYSLVKEDFPDIGNGNQSLDISFGNEGVRLGSGNSDLTQFRSKDGNTVIQLSNNLLTVNKLPKYKGWDDYYSIIKKAVTALYEVLEITSIHRLGLRVLNKIDIKEHTYQNFKNAFLVYPNIPNNTSKSVNSIQFKYEYPVPEMNHCIIQVVLATLKREKDYTAPVLFQLHYTKLSPSNQKEIDGFLENAHDNLYKLFEDSVTAKYKNLFDNE